MILGVTRDAALPVTDRLIVQMSYSGLWRCSVPTGHRAYVPAPSRVRIAEQALNHLATRTTIPRTLQILAGDPLHPQVALRPDARTLDPRAPPLGLSSSLVLNLVLRAIRDWTLVLVAASGLPLPVQLPTDARPEVLVVSLLGAQPYAIETWLAASLDPDVPRVAVLVPPSHASHTQVLLGCALTLTEIGNLTVVTSPGLSLAPVTTLWNPQDDIAPSPPAARGP